MGRPATLPPQAPTHVASNPGAALPFPELFDERAVIVWLGVDLRTIQRWRKEGKVRYRQVGSKIKYTREDVEWLLNSLLMTPASSIASPTNTPSSGARARRCSTSSGAKTGSPSGPLRAVENLNPPSAKPGS
ncbi:MAG: helix-turn-helix domain-containing protein [Pseudoxanthomonas sp.]